MEYLFLPYSIKSADMKRKPILHWSLKDAVIFHYFLLQYFTNPKLLN